MAASLSVVKVGGSLLGWPEFPARLKDLLQSDGLERVLLFPGGGAFADVVRRLDAQHRLGEERSHWLAVRTLSVSAHALADVLSLPVIQAPRAWLATPARAAIIDPLPWAMDDEADADHCPHAWTVTSDSLSFRLAHVVGAETLVLVKSTDLPPATPWSDAARQALVDAFFPQLASRYSEVAVRWINLRQAR